MPRPNRDVTHLNMSHSASMRLGDGRIHLSPWPRSRITSSPHEKSYPASQMAKAALCPTHTRHTRTSPNPSTTSAPEHLLRSTLESTAPGEDDPGLRHGEIVGINLRAVARDAAHALESLHFFTQLAACCACLRGQAALSDFCPTSRRGRPWPCPNVTLRTRTPAMAATG
jgi:hypothetical protein